MILKVPLSKCNIVKKDELEKNIILNNDVFKICTGCVDQYIVTNSNQLYGMISSFDIERKINKDGDFDVESIINRHPITVMHTERFERGLVDYIFKNTVYVRSIPIVNEKKQIQYVYIKLNKALEKFVEGYDFQNDVIQYQKNIRQEILRLEKTYSKMNIHVLTDFNRYEINLDEDIKGYYIDEKEIEMLHPCRDFVLLVYLYDFNCMNVIGRLAEKRIKFYTSNYTNRDITAEVTPYFKIDEAAKNTLLEEAYYNGNYFDLYDFQNIFQAIHMTEDLQGCYVEIGTYRGDSARAALSYMNNSGIIKKAYFLDTYEGFSYTEAEKSSDCEWANTHTDTSLDFVDERLQEFSNYKLIKSNIITDKLPEEIVDIAVCNIDVDMLEAVKAALEKVRSKMLPGGIIIAEDFGHTPALFGAQYAVKKFLNLYKNEFYSMYLQSGQFIMIKK